MTKMRKTKSMPGFTIMLWMIGICVNPSFVMAQNVNVKSVELTPASSVIKRENNGYWLYLNGQKKPALIGMVYQPVPKGRHIRDYVNNLGDLYQALRDDSDGGKGHGRQLATLGITAIRVYELPFHNPFDVENVKQIFRWLYTRHQIKVLVGNWAGLHSQVNFRDTVDRSEVKNDAIQMVRLYSREPWVLGWQVGNENNYHVRGGVLGHEIDLDLPEYYEFMDEVAGAVRQELNNFGVRQFIALGQGDLAPNEAGFIDRMVNIDAIGINTYRDAQGIEGIEKVINLAATKIPNRPVLFSEFGRSANTPLAEERQGVYLAQASDIIFKFGAGRLGSTGTLTFGNVLAGFIHEATDQDWKRLERGKDEDAHYGVLEKQSVTKLREFIADQESFYKVMPMSDTSEELMTSAWALLEGRRPDPGNAIGYAKRVIDLYQAKALEQQANLRSIDSERGDNEINQSWALNAVGAAHFLIIRTHYNQYAIDRCIDRFPLSEV